MLYAQTDQKPEEHARAAEKNKHRKESQKTDPTRADIYNELRRDLTTPENGALTMLAKDLDRVKGVEY